MGQRGPKPGSGGRPKKPIAEKIAAGNPGKRKLTVIDFDNKAADLDGETMPKPSEFLSATQKDGTQLCAVEIYEATWKWLNDRGCSHLISPQMIERYAMASARWIQCEAATSEFGFLADKYMTQSNRIWGEIFQIVRENCMTEYGGISPQDDVMERLLTARKGN